MQTKQTTAPPRNAPVVDREIGSATTAGSRPKRTALLMPHKLLLRRLWLAVTVPAHVNFAHGESINRKAWIHFGGGMERR